MVPYLDLVLYLDFTERDVQNELKVCTKEKDWLLVVAEKIRKIN